MSPENIRELRNQVEREDKHTEQECAKCLKNCATALLPTNDGILTYVDCEQICSSGRVDMIVIAEIFEPGGSTRMGAYVWELKAPQIHLFKWENQNQVRPSKELFEAENQLLHYHDSMANDGHWRERWGILLPDHVKFGGIIIGRDTDFIKCPPNEIVLGKKLASQALRKRESVFYIARNIRLLTWTMVINNIENQTVSHQRFIGKPDTTINIKGSLELTLPALVVSMSGESK